MIDYGDVKKLVLPFCCFSVLTTVARATISSSFMIEKSLRFKGSRCEE